MRRHGPVDDSQVVDEVFGFIDAHTEDGQAPSQFKVGPCRSLLTFAHAYVSYNNK